MRLVLPAMGVLMVLVGCGEAAHEEPAPAVTAPAVTAPAATAPAPASEALWEMDEHTREVMAETRAALDGATIGSVADAVALGGVLQEQLDRLIQGCTMTGADHDALHEFLMVYMPAVTALSKAADKAEAQTQVTALQEMVTDYAKRFH